MIVWRASGAQWQGGDSTSIRERWPYGCIIKLLVIGSYSYRYTVTLVLLEDTGEQ